MFARLVSVAVHMARILLALILGCLGESLTGLLVCNIIHELLLSLLNDFRNTQCLG